MVGGLAGDGEVEQQQQHRQQEDRGGRVENNVTQSHDEQ